MRNRRVEAAAARVESASAHARRATHGMETAAATVKTTAPAAAVESAATAAPAVSAPATTAAVAAAATTTAVAGSRCIGRQGSNHRHTCQKSEGKFVFHVTPSSLQRRPLPHASRHSTTSKTVRGYAGFPLSPVNFEQGCAAASGTSPIVAAGAFLRADVLECEGAGAAKMRLLVDRKVAGHCCARNGRLRGRKSKRRDQFDMSSVGNATSNLTEAARAGTAPPLLLAREGRGLARLAPTQPKARRGGA
jgi:hypothetical protein